MFIQEIEEEPADSHVAGPVDDSAPLRRAKSGKPSEEEIADASEIYYHLCKINRN